MRVAVFTANYGQVDDIVPAPTQTVDADFFIYGAEADGWKRRKLPKMKQFSNLETSRIPKALASTLFPDYDVTIWTCGLVKIRSSEFVQWCLSQLEDCLAAFFQHDDKRTIRQEMKACTSLYHGKETLPGQEEYYRLLGLNVEKRVSCGNLIIRRRHPRFRPMEAEWLLHQLLFCSNDQISMTHLLDRYEIPWRFIPGSIFASELWARDSNHAKQLSAHLSRRSEAAIET